MLRTKHGITLISLVITIIVLIILAGVAINVTFNQGDLFEKANNAVEKWNNEIAKEEDLINTMLEQLSGGEGDKVEITDNVEFSGIPTNWTQESITVSISHSNIPEGYEIQYKLEEEEWTPGESVVVEQNGIIYGRLYNGTTDDAAAEATENITFIDKEAPTTPIGIETTVQIAANETTTSLPTGWSNSKVAKVVNEKGNVIVKAIGGTDSLSGIAGYQYSIDNTNWTDTILSGTEHTFPEVTGNKIIYVKTVDNVGNTSEVYTKEVLRTAPIPVGYTVSQIPGENAIGGGLVIYEDETPVTGEKDSTEHISAMESRNQYVWIPVDDINDMVMCKKNKSGSVCKLELQGEELVCTTHGYTTAEGLTTANIDTTGLAGRLYGVQATTTVVDGNTIYKTDINFNNDIQTFTKDSGYREPDVLIDTTFADGNTSFLTDIGITAQEGKTEIEVFKEQLNIDYIKMAKSVAKYGGFYISRYEMGQNGTSKKNQNVVVGSKSSYGNNLAGNMWYGIYNTLRNETGVNTNVVKSHMIWRKSV